jgi:hypothetical protein
MNQFIQKELREMKIQRVVGKAGLPLRDYRGAQTKIRQTIDEDFVLQAVAGCMGEHRAQVANVALKVGLILMLAEDKDLFDEVKSRAKTMGYTIPSYLKLVDDLHANPLSFTVFNDIIDGEYSVISEE